MIKYRNNFVDAEFHYDVVDENGLLHGESVTRWTSIGADGVTTILHETRSTQITTQRELDANYHRIFKVDETKAIARMVGNFKEHCAKCDRRTLHVARCAEAMPHEETTLWRVVCGECRHATMQTRDIPSATRDESSRWWRSPVAPAMWAADGAETGA